MRTPISKRQQGLHTQINEAREKIARFQEELLALDQLLDSLSRQQPQYQLLTEICDSLEKLHGLGAHNLFWAEQHISENPEQTLQRMRQAVDAFQQKIIAVAQSRSALHETIQQQSNHIAKLKNQLADVLEEEEAIHDEFVIERTVSSMPYRTLVMPWSVQGDDERRYRKILLTFILLAIACGALLPLWKLPPREREEVQIPDRLAQFIKKKQVKPAEPKLPEKKKEAVDKKEEKMPSKEVTPETRQARAKAETRGVLAFKNNLAGLVKDGSPAKLGANARISTTGQGSGEGTQRSIIMAQQAITGQSSSGGINTSSLNRQMAGNAGKSITNSDTKFARVESTVNTASKEENRSLSKGPAPARSDEEIQIVFDRYKSALYRIYNRELRNDPTLRGKMVLRITIEPDGHVSACSIKSTDLASPALSADIVDRVLKFNFGTKEGVPSITILYPIDFLPAN